MNWTHKFDIKEDWQKAEKRDISVNDFSKLIGDKIMQSSFYNENDQTIVDIVEEFTYLGNAEWDDFDVVWDQFYNWADYHGVWIKTF